MRYVADLPVKDCAEVMEVGIDNMKMMRSCGSRACRRRAGSRSSQHRRHPDPFMGSSAAGPLRACARGIERDAVDRRIGDAVQRLRVHPRFEERLESAMRSEDKAAERRRVGGRIDVPGALSLLDE
ncbi:hypothetical protein ABZ455_44720 [Streptomyces avermitilis]